MSTTRFNRRRGALVALCAAAAVIGCTGSVPADTRSPGATSSPAAGSPGAADTPSPGSDNPNELFDDSVVHDVAVSLDDAAYEAMLDAFRATGEKGWLEATVTIDGRVYERAGIRLKGNSSLAGLRGGNMPGGGFVHVWPGGPAEPGASGAPNFPPASERGPAGPAAPAGPDVSADEPESLPWLVDLDRFVVDQNDHGVVEFVIRSNPSATALNEAVALELLELAGLASQDAIAVRFSVNGSAAALRLAIEHPDDVWMSKTFSATGALYKAESSGDYTYRGADPGAYDEVFDQEAGEQNADLTALIEFLEFINNVDDETFARELPQRLDVDAFATYLAMQGLLGNHDDIAGPGNNSYLYFDPDSGRFAVVPWDYNLAFGSLGFFERVDGPAASGDVVPLPSSASGPPGGGQGDGTIVVPGNGLPPGGAPGGGGPDVAPGGPSNVLAERYLEIDEYRSLVEQRENELRAELFDSSRAADTLARWVALLKEQASDLVDGATVDREAEAVERYFAGDMEGDR